MERVEILLVRSLQEFSDEKGITVHNGRVLYDNLNDRYKPRPLIHVPADDVKWLTPNSCKLLSLGVGHKLLLVSMFEIRGTPNHVLGGKCSNVLKREKMQHLLHDLSLSLTFRSYLCLIASLPYFFPKVLVSADRPSWPCLISLLSHQRREKQASGRVVSHRQNKNSIKGHYLTSCPPPWRHNIDVTIFAKMTWSFFRIPRDKKNLSQVKKTLWSSNQVSLCTFQLRFHKRLVLRRKEWTYNHSDCTNGNNIHHLKVSLPSANGFSLNRNFSGRICRRVSQRSF